VIHPDTQLVHVDPEVGRGVVATRPIPSGTITWVLDDLDRLFTESEVAALPPCYEPLLDRWAFNDGRGHHVLCWDFARFMNHSCEPNCGGTEFGLEVALRDIEPGDQLTNDYATFVLHPRERIDCRCGARACRGVVTHKDDPDAVAQVRRLLRAAVPAIGQVDQPLASLLRPGQLVAALNELGYGPDLPDLGPCLP
jgi:hypothetical protein